MGQLSVSTVSASSGPVYFSAPIAFSKEARLSVIGASGNIVSESSVSASAFFGDGSRLSGLPGANLWDDQIFSGANTFFSSMTMQSVGREILLSTAQAGSNISISTGGILIFNPVLHTSSRTIIPDTSTTQSSFGPCIAGSTIAIATSGGRVQVVFTGMVSGSGGGNPSLSFLQDGQFASGLNSQGSVNLASTPNGSSPSEGSFVYLVDALEEGMHSYCLSLAQIGGGTARIFNDSVNGNLFYVVELK